MVGKRILTEQRKLVHPIQRLLSWGLAGCALFLCSGCDQTAHEQHREQAEKNWSEVRAKVKYQLARQQYESGHVDDAASTVEEAIGLDPTAADSYVLLCRALLEKGDMAAARRVLRMAAKSGLESAELTYMEGVLAERSRQLSSALECYQKARQADPAEQDYLIAEAECLVALGRPEEARQRIGDALDDFDRNGTLDAMMAEISMLLGDNEAAVASFRHAISLLSDNDQIAEEFGLLLVRTGRFAEAVSLLKPLLDQGGQDVSPTVVRALAKCYLELGYADTADTMLRGWLRDHPADTAAWLLRAKAAVARDDLSLSRRCMRNVRRMAPASPETHLLQGYVCWRQGDLEGALDYLGRSLALVPNDVLTHCLLGQVSAEAGRVEQARRHWRRALQIEPGSRWAKTGLNELDGRAVRQTSETRDS